MTWQPKAMPIDWPLRELVAELRAIERTGRDVGRREWLQLARRFVRCKWFILRGGVPVPPRMRRVRR
jgi:hypothetical protein